MKITDMISKDRNPETLEMIGAVVEDIGITLAGREDMPVIEVALGANDDIAVVPMIKLLEEELTGRIWDEEEEIAALKNLKQGIDAIIARLNARIGSL